MKSKFEVTKPNSSHNLVIKLLECLQLLLIFFLEKICCAKISFQFPRKSFRYNKTLFYECSPDSLTNFTRKTSTVTNCLEAGSSTLSGLVEKVRKMSVNGSSLNDKGSEGSKFTPNSQRKYSSVRKSSSPSK